MVDDVLGREGRRGYRAGFQDAIFATDLGIRSYRLDEWRDTCFKRALKVAGGDVYEAARLMDVDHRTIRRWLQRSNECHELKS